MVEITTEIVSKVEISKGKFELHHIPEKHFFLVFKTDEETLVMWDTFISPTYEQAEKNFLKCLCGLI